METSKRMSNEVELRGSLTTSANETESHAIRSAVGDVAHGGHENPSGGASGDPLGSVVGDPQGGQPPADVGAERAAPPKRPKAARRRKLWTEDYKVGDRIEWRTGWDGPNAWWVGEVTAVADGGGSLVVTIDGGRDLEGHGAVHVVRKAGDVRHRIEREPAPVLEPAPLGFAVGDRVRVARSSTMRGRVGRVVAVDESSGLPYLVEFDATLGRLAIARGALELVELAGSGSPGVPDPEPGELVPFNGLESDDERAAFAVEPGADEYDVNDCTGGEECIPGQCSAHGRASLVAVELVAPPEWLRDDARVLDTASGRTGTIREVTPAPDRETFAVDVEWDDGGRTTVVADRLEPLASAATIPPTSPAPELSEPEALFAIHENLSGIVEAIDLSIRASEGPRVGVLVARRRVVQALEALTDGSTPPNDGEGEDLRTEFRERAEAAEAELARVRDERDQFWATLERERTTNVDDLRRAYDERDAARKAGAGLAAELERLQSLAAEAIEWRHAAEGLPQLLLDVARGRVECMRAALRGFTSPRVAGVVQRCGDVTASLGVALQLAAGVEERPRASSSNGHAAPVAIGGA